MNLNIIDNILSKKDNLKKQNDDIKYLLSTNIRLELYDYDLSNINNLNDGDNIILLKKNTLKIYKYCKYFKHNQKYIFLKNKYKNHKENIDDFYIFYKHVHSKKNMFKYLLDALNNQSLEINR